MKTLLILIALLVSSSFSNTETGSHGGKVFHHSGIDYELFHDPKLNQFRVYTKAPEALRPSQLTVKVIQGNQIIKRFHLRLDEGLDEDKSGNRSTYIGMVPADTLISGGVTYDIDF